MKELDLKKVIESRIKTEESKLKTKQMEYENCLKVKCNFDSQDIMNVSNNLTTLLRKMAEIEGKITIMKEILDCIDIL